MTVLSLGFYLAPSPADRNRRRTGVRSAGHAESHGHLANRVERVLLVPLSEERFRAKHFFSPI